MNIRNVCRFLIPFHLSLVGLFLVLPSGVEAQSPASLTISTARKRVDKETSQTTSTIASVESWSQMVTIQNNSIKPVENIEVKYRLYMIDDSHGASRAEMKLKWIEGKHNIENIERGRQFSFETEPVKLEKTELKGGWYYTDGAKAAVKDKVYGIWVKILKDGHLIQEYLNPTTLKKADSWTD